MSQELGIDLVATNDIHYINEEDEEPHDILLCLQTGKKLSDENRMRYEGGQYYVQIRGGDAGAVSRMRRRPSRIRTSIAERCHVEIEFGVTKLPKFDVPDGYTSWEYLNKLCSEGLERRYPQDDGTLRKQLDFELNVIKTMGYVDYFLIVWDFIHYARETWHCGRSRTRLRRRKYRILLSGDYEYRSNPLSAAVRAFPESGARKHAGY